MNGAEHLNENHGINIGDRLRKLRRQNKISIKKLAADLEMSYSYLSGLENNKHSITIVNLMRILEYFDIDLAYFFGNGDERSKIRFIPKNEVPKYETEDGLVFRIITSGYAENIEVSIITHPPQTPSLHRVYSHKSGEEEFISVLEGILYVEVDGKEHRLEVGDSILFHSRLDHSIFTRDCEATFLLISAPPYYTNLI
mgnify:CR=1 FL=1|jgi:transcriptional regulator with XRE-family HTH domain